MNKMDYFKDIYSDFFKEESILSKDNSYDRSQNDMTSLLLKIDDLYISDDSKVLLKKIIDYMKKYKNNEVSIYIPIRLIINSNSNKTVDDIKAIVYNFALQFSYIKNKDKTNYSLYNSNSEINLSNFGFINIKDLNGINLEDEKTNKKLFFKLSEFFEKEENIITIINGTNQEITNFFLGNNEFKDKYFNFCIDGKSPDSQDIYNNIINNIEINDNLKVDLLDYINKTYDKDIDYNEYEQKLIKYISFNENVPEIKEDMTTEEIFKELNELVGLKKVKKVLYELVDLMSLKNKTKDNLKINSINLHMVFLGNPGTGKTTIARMVANILYNLKYIKENKLIEVSSKDLVAEYVGQTAPKVAAVIEKSLNGVLFIDEAYTLSKTSNNSYNDEAIATLIQAMENYRDKLVVIFAGYTKEMQEFLNSNSGIVSRIGYTLEFEDYTTMELSEIFINMMNKSGFIVEDAALDYLKNIIDENRNMKNFGNARFIRNIYEKTIVRHATRVKNKKIKKLLTTITKEDISVDNLILK